MHGSLQLWIALGVIGAVLAYRDVAAATSRAHRTRTTALHALHSSTHAKRLDASDGAPIDVLAFELVPTGTLRSGDLLLCTPGDVLAVAGEVLEGAAWVVAPSMTGDPGAPVRASAHGRSHVARGTMVRAGYLVIRVSGTRDPATFADPQR